MANATLPSVFQGNLNDALSMNSSSSANTVSISTKRKRALGPKFYSVRVGHSPGIYYSWPDCLEQIKGFKKASFKSFSTLTDAEVFLSGGDPDQGDKPAASPHRFHAVRHGRKPGIYIDWPSALAQISGWKQSQYKCFSTRAEAQNYLDMTEELSAEGVPGQQNLEHANNGEDTVNSDELSTKRTKRSAVSDANNKAVKEAVVNSKQGRYEPGAGPLHTCSEDGFDPNIILDIDTANVNHKTQEQKQATKLQATGPTSGSALRVYTDGSSLRNGQKDALAGVGVWFGPNDSRNLSEPLTGSRQTNQRAELAAIGRALDSVPTDSDMTIVTDSRYAIDCLTVWCVKWRKNGWKTAAGKAVDHKDILESILGKIEERSNLFAQTRFEWIKGHATDLGNIEADKLAVSGARKPHRSSSMNE